MLRAKRRKSSLSCVQELLGLTNTGEVGDQAKVHQVRRGKVEAQTKALQVIHYVGPDVYQFWNFDTNPSFSYSKNTLDDKN